MNLRNKLDLLLLWQEIGKRNVPPDYVAKDCYQFGQEIGKELVNTDSALSEILSRYTFLETARSDYERSVRMGMFSIIERHLPDIAVELNDALDFVEASYAVSQVTPPNQRYHSEGYNLLKQIHATLSAARFPERELITLCSIIDECVADEVTYNVLRGCKAYMQDNNLKR